MTELIQIPEWATGSDKEIEVFLPLPFADYENIEVWIVNNANKAVEAKYTTDGTAVAPYITDGVSILIDQIDPDDGSLKDVVAIQIRRSTSKDFVAGVKYAEIKEVKTDPDWEDNEMHEIARQFFACYFVPQMTK